jgi:hypothetical protein
MLSDVFHINRYAVVSTLILNYVNCSLYLEMELTIMTMGVNSQKTMLWFDLYFL